MTTLQRICEELDPEDTHAGFRLWCTTYPSEVFPVAVLQNGVKMTNAPPKGIRANILGSYNVAPIADDTFFNGCTDKGYEFRRLVFGLCFFHALVQERRLYGPLGWNIAYEFNESDMRISVQQLLLFLEENETVPFKALNYTAGECNYGGRVTDDKDRRTLACILNRVYQPAFLDLHHDVSPSGLFKCPPDGSRESFIEFIDSFPLVAAPEVFGLHENATLTKDQNDTNALLTSVMDAEGGGGGGAAGGASKEDTILELAADIHAKLPSQFDMEYAALKYPVKWDESMNTVLCQELIKFNILLDLMKNSLVNVQKAVKGLVVMSKELEALGNQLFVNRTPLLWKTRSYPSLRPLSGYVADQAMRLKFFRDWLEVKKPSTFWISGFFFTQAFLTGASQNFARRYTIPIDDVVFDYEMRDEEWNELPNPPEDGVYTYGLYLEGCRWDKKAHELEDSLPKILFSLAPTMHWQPYRKKDLKSYPMYNCPVYKTSDRRGVLATTGHSSNFVCFISMPSNRPQDFWVERGVAMLTQLDD
jgi:dynein heavy chain